MLLNVLLISQHLLEWVGDTMAVYCDSIIRGSALTPPHHHHSKDHRSEKSLSKQHNVKSLFVIGPMVSLPHILKQLVIIAKIFSQAPKFTIIRLN